MAAQPVRLPQKAQSKYHAQPTVVDGIRFHSAREAARYGELKLLEKAGQIRNLEVQPRLILFVQPVQQNLDPLKVGVYIADFAYETGDDALSTVYEDVKGGPSTPLYRLKKKIAEALYGIQIREIR